MKNIAIIFAAFSTLTSAFATLVCDSDDYTVVISAEPKRVTIVEKATSREESTQIVVFEQKPGSELYHIDARIPEFLKEHDYRTNILVRTEARVYKNEPVYRAFVQRFDSGLGQYEIAPVIETEPCTIY